MENTTFKALVLLLLVSLTQVAQAQKEQPLEFIVGVTHSYLTTGTYSAFIDLGGIDGTNVSTLRGINNKPGLTIGVQKYKRLFKNLGTNAKAKLSLDRYQIDSLMSTVLVQDRVVSESVASATNANLVLDFTVSMAYLFPNDKVSISSGVEFGIGLKNFGSRNGEETTFVEYNYPYTDNFTVLEEPTLQPLDGGSPAAIQVGWTTSLGININPFSSVNIGFTKGIYQGYYPFGMDRISFFYSKRIRVEHKTNSEQLLGKI